MGDFDPTDYGAPAGDPLLDGEDADDGPDGDGEARDLKDAILFVIDCAYAGALAPLTPGGQSVVTQAMSAVVNALKTKVVTSPDDRVGVLLYGVREKQNPNNFEGIRILQDLDRPTAQRIRQIEQEAVRTAAQFEERYGSKRPTPLSDVFWTCTTIFNLSANPKQFRPRVFLFTGDDSPSDTPTERDAAETRAQDLMDLGVEVQFFPLVPADKAFSIERFWGRVLPVDPADFLERAAFRLEELEHRMRMRVHRKRTHQRLMFRISPDVEIGVTVYVTILEAKMPAPVYLLNENNKPLKSETRLLCGETGAILHAEDDIENYVELANQRVFMTRAEMVESRRFCEPGLCLIGFKPLSQLCANHRIFHSYFVYPNEQTVSGSNAFSATLIERMLDRRVMALARYTPRSNSEPVLVALIPQAEVLEGPEQLKPPGFHMVRLPWGEEIRPLKFPAPAGPLEGVRPEVPAEAAEGAHRAVEAMRMEGFYPGCVENPVLQKHYAAVQALALGEDKPEETADLLQPDSAALVAKAPVFKAWFHAVDEACPAPVAERMSAGVKRALPFMEGGSDGAPLPVRPRREPPPAVPDTPEAMRELVHSGEVERLTVPQLRDWLKSQGIATSGKKADLVDRVRNCA